MAAVNRIVRLLRGYAQGQGWGPEDYRLYFHVNERWNHVHIIFVARGFEGRDYFECYDSVWKHLEGGLKDSPELLSAIGLVIRTFKQVDEGGIYSIGSDYSEVPTEAGR